MDKNLVVTNRVFKQAIIDLIGSDTILPIMDNDDDILTSEIFKQYMTLVPSPGGGGGSAGSYYVKLTYKHPGGTATDDIEADKSVENIISAIKAGKSVYATLESREDLEYAEKVYRPTWYMDANSPVTEGHYLINFECLTNNGNLGPSNYSINAGTTDDGDVWSYNGGWDFATNINAAIYIASFNVNPSTGVISCYESLSNIYAAYTAGKAVIGKLRNSTAGVDNIYYLTTAGSGEAGIVVEFSNLFCNLGDELIFTSIVGSNVESQSDTWEGFMKDLEKDDPSKSIADFDIYAEATDPITSNSIRNYTGELDTSTVEIRTNKTMTQILNKIKKTANDNHGSSLIISGKTIWYDDEPDPKDYYVNQNAQGNYSSLQTYYELLNNEYVEVDLSSLYQDGDPIITDAFIFDYDTYDEQYLAYELNINQIPLSLIYYMVISKDAFNFLLSDGYYVSMNGGTYDASETYYKRSGWHYIEVDASAKYSDGDTIDDDIYIIDSSSELIQSDTDAIALVLGVEFPYDGSYNPVYCPSALQISPLVFESNNETVFTFLN